MAFEITDPVKYIVVEMVVALSDMAMIADRRLTAVVVVVAVEDMLVVRAHMAVVLADNETYAERVEAEEERERMNIDKVVVPADNWMVVDSYMLRCCCCQRRWRCLLIVRGELLL